MDSHNFREDSRESVIGLSAFADYSHSSWLLVEIERLLKPLSKEEREKTLQEVEEHLRCSRAAMEEMGFDQATADREAVAMFGSPSEFCKKLLCRRSTKQGVPRALLTIMVVTVMLPFLLAFSLYFAFLPIAYWVLVIGTLAFTIESWRARRFHWKPIAATGGVLTVFFSLALGFAWVDMWSTGGMGEAPRWTLRNFESTAEAQIRGIYSLRSQCSHIRETFAQGELAVFASPYHRNNHFQMFSMNESSPDGVPTYSILWTTNFEQAARSWRTYGGYNRSLDDTLVSAEAQIPAIDLAARRSFDVLTASQGLIGGVFVTCVALLINFVVSAVRWIFEQLRRLPRPHAA